MPTLFKNKLYSGLGTDEQTILTTNGSAKTTVVGLSLTNLTDNVVMASIKLTDPVEEITAYYVKDVMVPPNQSLRVINGGERLVLDPSTEVKMQANTDDSLDLVMSYVEIS
jgi:hypothetical protein